jgi:DNA-binding transcriptional ArsR family regulator/AraC-like DNA-binding protein
VLVDIDGTRRKAWLLLMRLMYSGRDFAWIYERQDQVSFLDGHVRAFALSAHGPSNTPSHQFQACMCIDLARRLLTKGVSSRDVALSAGLADQSHLVRWFKRLVGTTPTHYRRARATDTLSGCDRLAQIRNRQALDMSGTMHNHLVVDTLSVTLAALSDPTRRAILARLRAGPASVMDLREPFGVSQQAISKHLAYLERANLVRTRRAGRQQIRELNPAPIREVVDWAEAYRSYWEGAFNRLGDLLDRQAAGRQRRKRKP